MTNGAEPTCLAEAACGWVWELTGQRWLAEGSALLLAPVRILMITVMALVARRLLHRTINRLIRSTATGTPRLLRPLPERMRTAVGEVTIPPERRRQRAEAIGSALKSFVSLSIYAVVALLILGELGVNLAPLLASAGIAGIALGFGAQTLVKDVLAGLFMLLEDQYGVGDSVDIGDASGVVEAVGLRVTTVRDLRGVLWYVPNGEIRRVGNRSQGWAVVVVDMPIGFAPVAEATEALQRGAQGLADDPEFGSQLVEPPEVLGVDQVTVEGAVVRTIVKTSADAQWRIGRELRRRQAEELGTTGIAAQIVAARVYPTQVRTSDNQPIVRPVSQSGPH